MSASGLAWSASIADTQRTLRLERELAESRERPHRRFHEKLVATHNGIGAVSLDVAQYMTMLVAERLREHGDVAAADHFYRLMSRLLDGRAT